MKSPCAYYLLLLYITVVVKPLMPYIEDGWDHQFNNIEHISLIHAKYGCHHLDKELSDSTSDNDKNKNSIKSEEQTSFHVPSPEYKYDFSVNKSSTQYHSFQLLQIPFVCMSHQGPPPKFS